MVACTFNPTPMDAKERRSPKLARVTQLRPYNDKNIKPKMISSDRHVQAKSDKNLQEKQGWPAGYEVSWNSQEHKTDQMHNPGDTKVQRHKGGEPGWEKELPSSTRQGLLHYGHYTKLRPFPSSVSKHQPRQNYW